MPRPASRPLVERLLNWGYERALQSGPGLASAQELAREFLEGPATLSQKMDRLIRWQCAKAGAVGFVSGLGGLLAMPITIPGDVAAVTYLHLRMVVTIAIMAGHDPRSERVRTFAFLALVGHSVTAVLKEVGIEVGRRVVASLVERASAEMTLKLEQRLGTRLAVRAGQQSAVRLGRLIPLAGGFVGGAIDVLATRAVGKAAKKIFLPRPGTSPVLEGEVLRAEPRGTLPG